MQICAVCLRPSKLRYGESVCLTCLRILDREVQAGCKEVATLDRAYQQGWQRK